MDNVVLGVRVDAETETMIKNAADYLGLTISAFLRKAAETLIKAEVEKEYENLIEATQAALTANGTTDPADVLVYSGKLWKEMNGLGQKAVRNLLEMDPETRDKIIFAKYFVWAERGRK